MGIYINGKRYTGNNVSIINGRVVNGGGESETRKFDERKYEDASNIEKIVIDSVSCDVNIVASDTSKIEAHLHGQANSDGNLRLDVSKVRRQLKITVRNEGLFFNGNLKLDVTVPYKIFKEISIKTVSANVTLNENVLTEELRVNTTSGDLNTSATFTEARVTTVSGDVDLFLHAKQDIAVEISTTSGDVSAEFGNIGHMNLYNDTMSGDIRNRHKEKEEGYIADVDISTVSGDIRIR